MRTAIFSLNQCWLEGRGGRERWSGGSLSFVPQSVDTRSHCSSPSDNCEVLRRHASSSLHWRTSRMHSLLAVRRERDLAIAPNRGKELPDFFSLVNRENNDNEQIDLDQLPSREGNRAAGAPYASGISRIPVRMNTLNDGRDTWKERTSCLLFRMRFISSTGGCRPRQRSCPLFRIRVIMTMRGLRCIRPWPNEHGNENGCLPVHRWSAFDAPIARRDPNPTASLPNDFDPTGVSCFDEWSPLEMNAACH